MRRKVCFGRTYLLARLGLSRSMKIRQIRDHPRLSPSVSIPWSPFSKIVRVQFLGVGGGGSEKIRSPKNSRNHVQGKPSPGHSQCVDETAGPGSWRETHIHGYGSWAGICGSVFLCFIKLILGNRYATGVSSRTGQGARIYDTDRQRATSPLSPLNSIASNVVKVEGKGQRRSQGPQPPPELRRCLYQSPPLPLRIFCGCFADTQLARQLQQERTQVVCSNKETRNRLTESYGTPAMDLGHMNVVLKWCIYMLVVDLGIWIVFITILFYDICIYFHIFPPFFWFLESIKCVSGRDWCVVEEV